MTCHKYYKNYVGIGRPKALSCAVTAGLNVDVEDAFQALCTAHLDPSFGRRLILRFILRPSPTALAPLRRRHLRCSARTPHENG